MTDTRYRFTARLWVECEDDGDPLEQERAFDHVDDAADAARDLMLEAQRLGRTVGPRYGWTLVSGQRPGLPGAQSWPCGSSSS